MTNFINKKPATSLRTAFITIPEVSDTKSGHVTYSIQQLTQILVQWSISMADFNYFLIKHYSDPEELVTHFHIVLQFKHPVSFNTIKRKFPIGQIQSARSIYKSVQYLLHLNHPDKIQYKQEEVVSNLDDISPYLIDPKEKMLQILKQIEEGSIREYNIYNYIDASTYNKYRKTLENYFTYFREKFFMTKNRNIEGVFITGKSKSGKTTFVKTWAEGKNLSYCMGSSNNDPVQDYKGQDVLFLDDLDDKAFPYKDLVKMLDNNTKSTSRSRYYNKGFIGQYIIIASTKPLEDWYPEVKDKVELFRRLKQYIIISKKEVITKTFDEDSDTYKLDSKEPNEVLDSFPEYISPPSLIEQLKEIQAKKK